MGGGGMLTLFGALSLAELGSIYPGTGGLWLDLNGWTLHPIRRIRSRALRNVRHRWTGQGGNYKGEADPFKLTIARSSGTHKPPSLTLFSCVQVVVLYFRAT
jgi:hypothetical protein